MMPTSFHTLWKTDGRWGSTDAHLRCNAKQNLRLERASGATVCQCVAV